MEAFIKAIRMWVKNGQLKKYLRIKLVFGDWLDVD